MLLRSCGVFIYMAGGGGAREEAGAGGIYGSIRLGGLMSGRQPRSERFRSERGWSGREGLLAVFYVNS